jgi:ribonuclease E
MKRMLFNATHSEELRVAIVDGQKLIDIDIESAGREQRKSNIYKGIITRIEPSLEACFINYGEDRHGFLPFKEISKQYFKPGSDSGKARVQDVLQEGQELLVQIEKEERGNKGAALTTFISLAGRYLVLMPNNPRGGGVSRRVEGEERQELREAMDRLVLPPGMSVIARTAGIGRKVEELQWDLNYLLQLWRAVDSAAQGTHGAFLIYQESSLVIRAIRDYFHADIGEILIDTDEIHEQARQFMAHVMPDMLERVKRYRDDIPLFSRFQIEHQIETAYSRMVPLPSGGAIVIDHTEALVAIDVNSARSTKGSDIEETAVRTNLEAAEEVGRQLRLRDLGGLIVIDFIDMEKTGNQRDVENRLKDALHHDRARVQMGKISRFGLIELSRQRLRPALNEGSHTTCPRCNGTGVIRDTESSALHLLRIIQEEAMKEGTAALRAQVPVDVATFLLNEKRSEIFKIEARLKVNIVLIPNKTFETPHYDLLRLRHDDERLDTDKLSFQIAEHQAEENYYDLKTEQAQKTPRQEAMIKGITPDKPAPVIARTPIQSPAPMTAPEKLPLIEKIRGWFKQIAQPAEPVIPAPIETAEPNTERGRGRSGSTRGERSSNIRTRTPREKPSQTAATTSENGAENTAQRSDRGGRRVRNNNADKPVEKEHAPSLRQVQNVQTSETSNEARPGRPARQRRERRPSSESTVDSAATTDSAAAMTITADTTSEDVAAVANAIAETIAYGNSDSLEDTNRDAKRRRRRRRGRSGRDSDEAIVEQHSVSADETEFEPGTSDEATVASVEPLPPAELSTAPEPVAVPQPILPPAVAQQTVTSQITNAELKQVVADLGMVWVETDAIKWQAFQTEAAQHIRPTSPQRERPVLPPLSSQPLVQVETRKGNN